MAGAPVITVDGPSGSGKGTICQLLADRLRWRLLDSGALYRLVGIAGADQGVDLDDGMALAQLAAGLPVTFAPTELGEPAAVVLGGEDMSHRVRSEEAGHLASRVAVHPEVREALLELQRGFAQPPGLVADGRDMGTVVFPDAKLKLFLTASARERAERRHNQLKNKGVSVNLATLLEEIEARDKADSERTVSPLKPAEDAVVIDSTELDIQAVFDRVLDELRAKGLAPQQ